METMAVNRIVCPQCEALLEPSAHRCPYCGAPTTITPIAPARPTRRLFDRPWVVLIVLLHVGVLGIPYYWKTPYPVAVRAGLVFLSVCYTVFAVAVIAWGVWQIGRAVQSLS
jgi:hypothetical protein